MGATPLQSGDRATIVAGPFVGMAGTVASPAEVAARWPDSPASGAADRGEEVWLVVPVYGRDVPVLLSADQLAAGVDGARLTGRSSRPQPHDGLLNSTGSPAAGAVERVVPRAEGGPQEEKSPSADADLFFDLAFSGKAPGVSQRHLEGKTRSGRPFAYEFSEYPIGAGTTPDGALALARRIVSDRYRESEWDRRHPHVDVELELVFELTSFIMEVAARLGHREPIKPQLVTSWGIACDEELVEVYPDCERAAAEQRLGELIARDGNCYALRPLNRISLPSTASE